MLFGTVPPLPFLSRALSLFSLLFSLLLCHRAHVLQKHSLDDDSLKVDAGADFVLLQLSWSAPAILTFVEACRECGIAVPIVPGIMAPQSLAVLETFANVCAVPTAEIPGNLRRALGDFIHLLLSELYD